MKCHICNKELEVKKMKGAGKTKKITYNGVYRSKWICFECNEILIKTPSEKIVEVKTKCTSASGKHKWARGWKDGWDEEKNDWKENWSYLSKTCLVCGYDKNKKKYKTIKPVCVICGKQYTGYGNNAEPVKKGDCCDSCNYSVVVPKRLEELRR